MPIGWNGLSMATSVCSAHMPIGRVNINVRGVKWDPVPYMMKIVLTNIPPTCRIVDSNVNRDHMHLDPISPKKNVRH